MQRITVRFLFLSYNFKAYVKLTSAAKTFARSRGQLMQFEILDCHSYTLFEKYLHLTPPVCVAADRLLSENLI